MKIKFENIETRLIVILENVEGNRDDTKISIHIEMPFGIDGNDVTYMQYALNSAFNKINKEVIMFGAKRAKD